MVDSEEEDVDSAAALVVQVPVLAVVKAGLRQLEVLAVVTAPSVVLAQPTAVLVVVTAAEEEPGCRAPAGPPVVLSRNGKDFTVTGETDVRAGTEIKVTTERPSLSLSVKELDSGSWVIFELPGFTTAASGTEQSSLDALRKASDTSYYKGNGSLWVKLVSTGDILGSGPDRGPGGGASLQASR